MVICLVYASESTGDIKDSVGEILDASERNNPRDHITGMLCSNRTYFLQCMEGPRLEVTAAFKRIINDSRHKNCELIECLEGTERNFAGWSMGYVGNTTEAMDLMHKYLDGKDFNPYLLKSGQALALLKELSATLLSQTTRVTPPKRNAKPIAAS